MPRLFIAIPVSDAVRTAMDFVWFPNSNSLRQTPLSELHLTLHFLGDVSESGCTELRIALRQIQGCAFILIMGQAGFFGGRSRPEILWAGVERNTQLLSLHSTIANCLRTLSLPVEAREYCPHLTLARMKTPDAKAAHDFVEANSTLHCTMEVEQFCLYSSNPNSTAGRYQIIESYPLRRDSNSIPCS